MRTSLEDWVGWSAEARSVWLDGVLEQLPPWLALLEPLRPLPVFEDQRHGQRFLLALEASVVLGLTEERRAGVDAMLRREWLQLFTPELHLPALAVHVRSHFVALEPMTFEGHDWILGANRAALQLELAERGWRLPSEAEWELAWQVLRPLASIDFGQAELCADDWHVGYAGAPLDGMPWGRGAEVVRAWDPSGSSVDAVLPSRRSVSASDLVQVRPVIDAPA